MDNLKLSSLIANRFPECLNGEVSFKPLYFPHIPDSRQKKAEKNFVKYKCENETMIMLFDTSLFERGKNGLVFTDKAVYFKDLFSETYCCKYSDWRRDKDDIAAILNISKENPTFLASFLNVLMNDISIMIEYED